MIVRIYGKEPWISVADKTYEEEEEENLSHTTGNYESSSGQTGWCKNEDLGLQTSYSKNIFLNLVYISTI